MRSSPTATATMERRPPLAARVLAMMYTKESQQIEHGMLLRQSRHGRLQLAQRLAVWGWHTLQPMSAVPSHRLHHHGPEPSTGSAYLGLFFLEAQCFFFSYFRGMHNTWHRATPCRGCDCSSRGLPLAEQSARRYWRSVEGGTVLILSRNLWTKVWLSILHKQN